MGERRECHLIVCSLKVRVEDRRGDGTVQGGWREVMVRRNGSRLVYMFMNRLINLFGSYYASLIFRPQCKI